MTFDEKNTLIKWCCIGSVDPWVLKRLQGRAVDNDSGIIAKIEEGLLEFYVKQSVQPRVDIYPPRNI